MINGNYVSAIEAYRQSSLQSAATWNKIGIAYHHLFALEEARKNYQRALALNPRYPDALNNLAAVYDGERKYKKAEKTYKRALKYGPNSAVTYRNLGTAYFSDGNYKEGAKAYRKALELNPNSFDPDQTEVKEERISRYQRVAINYCLAKTYAMTGNNVQALICLRKALDAGSQQSPAPHGGQGIRPAPHDTGVPTTSCCAPPGLGWGTRRLKSERSIPAICASRRRGAINDGPPQRDSESRVEICSLDRSSRERGYTCLPDPPG